MEPIDVLEKKAIDAAIRLDWNTAIEINKALLKKEKQNLSAILRLGFAYFQKNDLVLAKISYQKALRLQPSNNVAKENLEKIQILSSKKSRRNTKNPARFDPNLFLEIPGKTKTFNLVNLGQKNILAQLNIGEEVFLGSKRRRIEIRTKEKEYIGSLPDDISRRLSFFMKAKSEYSCFIKEVSLTRVTVFIREEKKGKKVAKYLSFPHTAQRTITQMHHEEEGEAETETAAEENDIEKLAEALTNEEKEYLPYKSEEEEEEEEE